MEARSIVRRVNMVFEFNGTFTEGLREDRSVGSYMGVHQDFQRLLYSSHNVVRNFRRVVSWWRRRFTVLLQ